MIAERRRLFFSFLDQAALKSDAIARDTILFANVSCSCFLADSRSLDKFTIAFMVHTKPALLLCICREL